MQAPNSDWLCARWGKGESVLRPDCAFNRESQGPEFLLHIAFQQQRSLAVQQVAAALINLGEKSALHQAGFVLKGEKLHGLPVFGADNFAGDQPAEKTNLLAMSPAAAVQADQLSGRQGSGPLALLGKKSDGMDAAEKP